MHKKSSEPYQERPRRQTYVYRYRCIERFVDVNAPQLVFDKFKVVQQEWVTDEQGGVNFILMESRCKLPGFLSQLYTDSEACNVI